MFPSTGAITTQVNTVGLHAKRHYVSSEAFASHAVSTPAIILDW
jgi:hypothetical protein